MASGPPLDNPYAPPAEDAPRRAPGPTAALRAAAVLSQLWSLLFLFGTCGLLVPQVALGRWDRFAIAAVVGGGASFALGYAGHGLRRHRRRAGLLALGTSGALAVLSALGVAPLGLIGAAVNAAIVILVAVSWRALTA